MSTLGLRGSPKNSIRPRGTTHPWKAAGTTSVAQTHSDPLPRSRERSTSGAKWTRPSPSSSSSLRPRGSCSTPFSRRHRRRSYRRRQPSEPVSRTHRRSCPCRRRLHQPAPPASRIPPPSAPSAPFAPAPPTPLLLPSTVPSASPIEATAAADGTLSLAASPPPPPPPPPPPAAPTTAALGEDADSTGGVESPPIEGGLLPGVLCLWRVYLQKDAGRRQQAWKTNRTGVKS